MIMRTCFGGKNDFSEKITFKLILFSEVSSFRVE